MYELTNSFSVCFNCMKIKYTLYDQSFDEIGLIGPQDSVNVFINLESVFNHITAIKDVDKKLVTETNFPRDIAADILNLAAHYKRFFRGNRLETRVFLYMTDLDSTSFKEEAYNEDYRSYYLNKFNGNPRYSELSEKLKSEIFPEVKQIMEFIPNVYLCVTKNMDASVVPAVIAEKYPTSKNVVVTGDVYDTQYNFWKGFVVHYIRKSPLYSSTSWSLKGYLREIFKKEPDEGTEVNILSNLSMYLCVLSVLGEKARSIDPIRKLGPATVLKLLRQGIESKMITYKTESIDIIKEVFPIEAQEELVSNFYQFSIQEKVKDLTDKDKFDITSCIVDRFDNNSLLKLNATRFYDHQLMLQELTN